MRYVIINNREDTMTREITWTTGDNGQARVRVLLITSKVLDADGDKIAVPCCEMTITADINGERIGYGIPQRVDHPVAVARIGKLGINADNMARVEAAINDIKASPEWQAHEAKIEANRKANIEYDRHSAMMRKAMQE
jgi:hypothetical protein